MKQFIILTAIIPILMMFAAQTVYDRKVDYSIRLIHDAVYAAKEEAKAEGSFTYEIQDRLKENLSAALEIPSAEISVVCRDEAPALYYRVEVPIKDVVAGGKLLGIGDEENQYKYVIDSYTRAAFKAEPEAGGEGADAGEAGPGESGGVDSMGESESGNGGEDTVDSDGPEDVKEMGGREDVEDADGAEKGEGDESPANSKNTGGVGSPADSENVRVGEGEAGPGESEGY